MRKKEPDQVTAGISGSTNDPNLHRMLFLAGMMLILFLRGIFICPGIYMLSSVPIPSEWSALKSVGRDHNPCGYFHGCRTFSLPVSCGRIDMLFYYND
jgi:hypothetical protein